MKTVKIHDREFKLYLPYEKIRSVVDGLAERINHDYSGRNPLFLCILNGSFMFAAELFKRIEFLDAEISFVKVASYAGTHTTGEVKQLIGLNESIEGRHVVVIEDIVDSGITIENIFNQINALSPESVKIVTLLLKPDALRKSVQLDYVGLEIPNDFIVGYGLDYNGCGRNLLDIYSVI
jgi:hypoxanthine phosphoribosyltransferase